MLAFKKHAFNLIKPEWILGAGIKLNRHARTFNGQKERGPLVLHRRRRKKTNGTEDSLCIELFERRSPLIIPTPSDVWWRILLPKRSPLIHHIYPACRGVNLLFIIKYEGSCCGRGLYVMVCNKSHSIWLAPLRAKIFRPGAVSASLVRASRIDARVIFQ